MISNFECKPMPSIYFGKGYFSQLFNIIKSHGDHILLVVGKSSFIDSLHYQQLTQALSDRSVHLTTVHINHEPTPDMIDGWVQQYSQQPVDLVVAIGGGSCLDAGKAIAALLTYNESIYEYLEGVGNGKPYLGRVIPLVVVPTTAGTGSELTSNAVIGLQGDKGFKKSFRHTSLLPDVAIIDPDLLTTCPRNVLLACAMDALTHLMEAYLSTTSNPITDALAISGLSAFYRGLSGIDDNQEESLAYLSYASMLGGFCLTNAGLGLVHGIVPDLGAFYNIPHGVGCSILLPKVTRLNIESLLQQDPEGAALEKYANIGRIFCKKTLSHDASCQALIQQLDVWEGQFGPWRLSDYKLTENDIVSIAERAQLRNNPVNIDKKQIEHCLMRCL